MTPDPTARSSRTRDALRRVRAAEPAGPGATRSRCRWIDVHSSSQLQFKRLGLFVRRVLRFGQTRAKLRCEESDAWRLHNLEMIAGHQVQVDAAPDQRRPS